MLSGGLNVVMTVIGFAGSAMFMVFVCTRLICARLHLRNSSYARRSSSGPPIVERGIHGLEPVLLTGFPMKQFKEQPGQDTQCTVCLADYQERDVLRVLPYCGHSFHVTCIDLWLKQHSTCPICRISLRGSPERKRGMMSPLSSAAIRSVYSPGLAELNSCQSTSGPSTCERTPADPSKTTAPMDDEAGSERDLEMVISVQNSTNRFR